MAEKTAISANVITRNGKLINVITYSDGTTAENDLGAAPAQGSALEVLRSMFASQGLTDLADVLWAEISNPDITDSQRLLNVQNSKPYNDRFPGMAELRKRGQAIDEATYIGQERSYYDLIVNTYKLPDGFYTSRKDFADFMVNGVSPAALAKRLDAATRVAQETDPNTRTALREFYGVDESQIMAYIIDPDRGQPLIDKQVQAARLQGAATKAGLNLGSTYAEDLAAGAGAALEGTTMATRFTQARLLADEQAKLAAIEGTSYTPLEAVSAVLKGDTESVLASTARAERERGRFKGQSGITRTTLGKASI